MSFNETHTINIDITDTVDVIDVCIVHRYVNGQVRVRVAACEIDVPVTVYVTDDGDVECGENGMDYDAASSALKNVAEILGDTTARNIALDATQRLADAVREGLRDADSIYRDELAGLTPAVS